MGIKKGASALSEWCLHQLGSRPTVFLPRWKAHPCILYQVCATRGATAAVAFKTYFFVSSLSNYWSQLPPNVNNTYAKLSCNVCKQTDFVLLKKYCHGIAVTFAISTMSPRLYPEWYRWRKMALMLYIVEASCVWLLERSMNVKRLHQYRVQFQVK